MLRVDAFAAQRPAVSGRLLDAEQATIALDCLLTNGDLRPLKDALTVAPQPTLISSAKTLYKYGAHWLSWASDVDAVSSPVRQDSYQRVYYTGDGEPKYTTNLVATGAGRNPVGEYTLGVPPPDVPTHSYTPPPTNDDPLDDRTRFYVLTYVTALGEESAPSPVSDAVVVQDPANDTVTLSLPTPLVNTQQITGIHVYRSISGGDDAGFFRITSAALPIGTATFEDTPALTQGPELATREYEAPPSDMHALIKMTGGFLLGASGQTVCPSEAYLPYAYKRSNQQVANAEIVALAPLPQGAVVLTTGYPEIVSGTSPDALFLDRLEIEQSCVSKRSVVDMGSRIIYASPDGLVEVSIQGARLLTEQVIEREQWQALNPATLHAYQHEGQYIAFYDGVGGLVFDPARRDMVFLSFYADAGYRDLQSDKLYLLMGNELRTWRDGPVRTGTWCSKEYRTDPRSFSLIRVKFRPGEDITGTVVRVITEDGELFNETLTDRDWEYLPAGIFSSWQIEVQTTAQIEALILADDAEEIAL